jgi:hypothetical protein
MTLTGIDETSFSEPYSLPLAVFSDEERVATTTQALQAIAKRLKQRAARSVLPQGRASPACGHVVPPKLDHVRVVVT